MSGSGVTTRYADTLNEHIRNNTVDTPYSTLYLALLTADAAASDRMDSSQNSAKELSTGTGYARKAITFGASSGGIMSNSAQITVGPFTDDPDTVTDFWIMSSASGAGEILFYGDLASDLDADSSGSIVFEVGEVKVTTT